MPRTQADPLLPSTFAAMGSVEADLLRVVPEFVEREPGSILDARRAQLSTSQSRSALLLIPCDVF